MILFSKIHPDVVISSLNAKKYISNNFNYCFIGIVNPENNKVKNILTNKCYEFNNGVVLINGNKYVGLNFNKDIRFTQEDSLFPYYVLRVNPKFNKCDIFLANRKQLDRTLDEQLIQNNKYFSKFFIRHFLNCVNENIHQTYEGLIKLKNINLLNKISQKNNEK